MSSESDPHEWLRNKEDPAVLAHLQAENAHTVASLEHNADLAGVIYDEIKSRVKEADLSVPVTIDGWMYYSRTAEGKSYSLYCRRRVGTDESTEQVILDENLEAGDAEYFEIGVFEVSPDHKLLLWGNDLTGAERFSLKIRDLESGVDTELPIDDASYGSAWAMDNRTFFTVRSDESDRPYEIVRHEIGSDDAHAVYTERDGRYFVSVGRERDDSFIQISSSSNMSDELWLIPASAPTSDLRCFAPRQEGLEYSAAHHEGSFYVLTNLGGATNFKLCRVADDDTAIERGKKLSLSVLTSCLLVLRHLILILFYTCGLKA